MPPAPPIASPGARFFMIATGVFVLVLWLMPLEGHSLSEWLGYLGGIDFVRSYGSVVCAILFICLGLLPFRSRNRAPFATLVAISWLAVAPGSALSGVLHPAHQLLALFAFVTLPLGVFLSSKLSDTPLRWLSPLALVTAYLLPTVRGSFLKIAYVHVNSAEVDDVAQGTLLFMPLFLWIIGELIRFFPMMTATERRVEPGIILTTIFLCWPSMMFALWAQLAHVPVLYRVAPVWTLMSLVAILTLLEIYQFRDST